MRSSVCLALLWIASSSLLFGAATPALEISAPRQESSVRADASDAKLDAAGESEPDGETKNEVASALAALNEEPPHSKPRTILSNRLLMTGAMVIVLLGQLSVLFGYLKINHATRGFYSGRLQSFSVVASAAVFAIGYLFFMAWKI